MNTGDKCAASHNKTKKRKKRGRGPPCYNTATPAVAVPGNYGPDGSIAIADAKCSPIWRIIQ